MNKVNQIILKLASLQASILHNANAYDDDLESSWERMKEDYENLKVILDNYIKQGEQ